MEGEKKGWKVIDTEKEDQGELSALLVSGILPRPIAFVSSISETGVENLAPFSWFNLVSNHPPIVSISCRNAPRVKDTATNAKSGLGFTINIISEPFVENATATAIDAPPEFNEWEISGLTKAPSVHVKAARVKESAFSMECELFQSIDIAHPVTGEHTATLILAHVKYIHIRKDVLNERGRVDIIKFKPVARLGDITFGRISNAYRVPTPSWAKDGDKARRALQAKLPSKL